LGALLTNETGTTGAKFGFCAQAQRCQIIEMQSVFEAAGGTDGLERLAAAWHRRVMADEIVAHAFSHGFRSDHVERVAAYWAEALGEGIAWNVR
jgi:hypothetical protein